MATKARVAILRVTPETILADTERLMELAGLRQALAPQSTTILKDNISWHFPFPAANTTPWQLEGVTRALRQAGYQDLVCVQNKTVVTNAFKGEDLNHYLPIFEKYAIPVRYNFRATDMAWIDYKPQHPMLVLDRIFPDGIRIPDYFVGKNIVHLPTMKCVAGDTEVMLADGTSIAIRDLVARQMATAAESVEIDGDIRCAGNVDLLAMDPDGKIGPHTATWFWRTGSSGRPVLRLLSRTGRGLTATADHQVWTPSGWRPLAELRAGDSIAIARSTPVGGVSQRLPRPQVASAGPRPVVARAGRKYGTVYCQSVIDRYCGGESVPQIAKSNGVRWQVVQAILKRHGFQLRRNITEIQIPATTSCEFWRWIGYVMAEGCIESTPRGSHKLWWVNGEAAIRADFEALTLQLFGLQVRWHRDGRACHVYSRRLGEFLHELGLPLPLTAGNKLIPQVLYRCPNDEIAAFLSAYLDGDGTVSRKQAELSAVTKSPDLAKGLQRLFARFGAIAFVRPTWNSIPGKWLEARVYHRVAVSGDGLVRMRNALALRHPLKARHLQEQATRFLSGKQPSNWDVVPFDANTFRGVRLGLGMTQVETGRPSSVNAIENGSSRPTPRIARAIVERFSAAEHESEYRNEIHDLQVLASPDLAWDTVEELREVDGADVDLYDVTVPSAGSFVGNGLILHNCHIYTTTTGAMKNAFGGLLNTKRHYTHSWIHATLVDLLAIQKEIHSGLFAVMDGTTAGNGPGPRTMFPVIKNIMLASADQVAIDAVAAKMMGFDPMRLEYIARADAAGLGVGRPAEIEILGDSAAANENWGFQVGDNGASRVGDFMWFGPLKSIQNLFFRTPLVNAFIFGSEAYHDFYRWPAKDRATFERWQRDTTWGRLFARYAQQGTLAVPAAAGPPPR